MITKWKHERDAALMPLSAYERIQLKQICRLAIRLDERLAIPASSSNFSMRAPGGLLVTKSGIHKRLITPSSFLRVGLNGVGLTPHSPKPSDETLLHCALYKMIPEAKIILHCHPFEIEKMRAPAHLFEGHELLKALGIKDHETSLSFPVLANDQDMKALSAKVLKLEKQVQAAKGFALQQHGIYVWGSSAESALCHLEALLHLV